MGKKRKATISVDPELFKKFSDYCEKEYGLKASQVLRLFMKQFIEGKTELKFVKKKEEL